MKSEQTCLQKEKWGFNDGVTPDDSLSARPAPLSGVSQDTSSPTVLAVVFIQPVRKLPTPGLGALSKLGQDISIIHHLTEPFRTQHPPSHLTEGAGQALPMAGNQCAPAKEPPASQQNYTEKHIKKT